MIVKIPDIFYFKRILVFFLSKLSERSVNQDQTLLCSVTVGYIVFFSLFINIFFCLARSCQVGFDS